MITNKINVNVKKYKNVTFRLRRHSSYCVANVTHWKSL